MILNESNVETVVVGGTGKQKKFGISDNKVIFDILRNKLYTDPIGAICREVVSNSRDANRENNKADVPVEVRIINGSSEDFGFVGDCAISFKDSGIGISPDRMENVFLLYGESTKRETNEQTGGFGLGAKTPFAYSDSFTIVTTVQEKDKRTKYYYMATIGGDEKGDLHLIKKMTTLEETGTEIIIPLKKNDVSKFQTNVIYYTNYWKVRPVLTNFYSRHDDLKHSIEFDDFTYHAHGDGMILLIDEIPYKYPTMFHGPRHGSYSINFPNGTFDIGGARESIQDKEENKKIIRERVAKVMAFATQKLEEITSKMTKAEALLFHSECFFKLPDQISISVALHSIINNDILEWNGDKLTNITWFQYFKYIPPTPWYGARPKKRDFGPATKNVNKTVYLSTTNDNKDLLSKVRYLNKNEQNTFIIFNDFTNHRLNSNFYHHADLAQATVDAYLKGTHPKDFLGDVVKLGTVDIQEYEMNRVKALLDDNKGMAELEQKLKSIKECIELEQEILKLMFKEIKDISLVPKDKGEKKERPNQPIKVMYVNLYCGSAADDDYVYKNKISRKIKKEDDQSFSDCVIIKTGSVSSEEYVTYERNVVGAVLAAFKVTGSSKKLIAAASNYQSILNAGAITAADYLKSLSDDEVTKVRKYALLGKCPWNIFDLFRSHKEMFDKEDTEAFSYCMNIKDKNSFEVPLGMLRKISFDIVFNDRELSLIDPSPVSKLFGKYPMIDLIKKMSTSDMKEMKDTIHDYMKLIQTINKTNDEKK